MPSASRAARSLRATGGSILEDGPFTNSPISLSFSRAFLLSMPSSAAISCTRGLATVLLVGPTPDEEEALVVDGTHFEPLISGCSLEGVHWIFVSLFIEGRAVAPRLVKRDAGWTFHADSGARARSVSTSIGPSKWSARPKALRFIEDSMHARRGCTQAPRPGSDADGSTVAPPLCTTTLTREDASTRWRQPRQVLTDFIVSPIAGAPLAALVEPVEPRSTRQRQPRSATRWHVKIPATLAVDVTVLTHVGCRARLDIQQNYESSSIESGWISILAPVNFAARRAF